MAKENYYTVDCRNKFEAFNSDGNDSSDEAIIQTKPPKKESTLINGVKSTVSKTKKNVSVSKPVVNGKELVPEQVESPNNPKSRGGFRDSRNSRFGGPREFVDKDSKVDETKDHWGKSVRTRPPRNEKFGNRRREFDRHSGDGLSREKKGGAGGHNWGSTFQEYNNNKVAKTNEEESKSDDKTPEVEVEKRHIEFINFDEFKRLQESMRVNLPTNDNAPKVTTNVDLEAQGFEKYVKEHEDSNSPIADVQNRKKKSPYMHENLHNQNDKLQFFPHRRESKRGGRNNESKHNSGKGKNTKKSEAPNLQDECAFPKLN